MSLTKYPNFFFHAAFSYLIQMQFSLRGKWPKERYNTVHEIQMLVAVDLHFIWVTHVLNNQFRELAYLLSHLRSVTEHLELPWAKAFLRRTRFLEPDFQGDVLAVISASLYGLYGRLKLIGYE